MVDILHVANTCERHLLLHIVTEPIATDGIPESRRYDGSEKQTSIDHRLECEATVERERHAPVGIDIAHSRLTVQLGKVIGQIGIFGFESCTTGREVPVVFAVVVDAGMITVEMLILECRLDGCLRTEHIAVVHVVPP